MITTKKVNDFTIIKETHLPGEELVVTTQIPAEVFVLAVYMQGSSYVESKASAEMKSGGKLYSFYTNPNIGAFRHESNEKIHLQKLLLMVPYNRLQALFASEPTRVAEVIAIDPTADGYKKGQSYRLNPEILRIIEQIESNKYNGALQNINLESQCLALLAEHFTQIETMKKLPTGISHSDITRLHNAKQIILSRLHNPMSLQQLARAVNLNTFKLKSGFKELFGTSVFKFIQTERMQIAYNLLSKGELNVQEVGWAVGYESLSSFSNSFFKTYQFRPSDLLNKQ